MPIAKLLGAPELRLLERAAFNGRHFESWQDFHNYIPWDLYFLQETHLGHHSFVGEKFFNLGGFKTKMALKSSMNPWKWIHRLWLSKVQGQIVRLSGCRRDNEGYITTPPPQYITTPPRYITQYITTPPPGLPCSDASQSIDNNSALNQHNWNGLLIPLLNCAQAQR